MTLGTAVIEKLVSRFWIVQIIQLACCRQSAAPACRAATMIGHCQSLAVQVRCSSYTWGTFEAVIWLCRGGKRKTTGRKGGARLPAMVLQQ